MGPVRGDRGRAAQFSGLNVSLTPVASTRCPIGIRRVHIVVVDGMTILDFDAEQAGLIDTMYATPDVVAQRQFVLGLLDLQAGERVLDIGSGPGYLISEMGAAVGRGRRGARFGRQRRHERDRRTPLRRQTLGADRRG